MSTVNDRFLRNLIMAGFYLLSEFLPEICWEEVFEEIFFSFARSAVLLKLNVANILLFNFCKQKFVQQGPLTIVINCDVLSLPIFEEKLSNYASGPKSVGFSMYACGFSMPQMRHFCFFIYPPSEKLIFFLLKSASFAKRIQAYTQPYSFGGSIKLIIYQIRHELSATVHEISSRWKQNR